MKKRMMSMALCLCMALSLAVPAGAVNLSKPENETLTLKGFSYNMDGSNIDKDYSYTVDADVVIDGESAYVSIEDAPDELAKYDLPNLEMEKIDDTAYIHRLNDDVEVFLEKTETDSTLLDIIVNDRAYAFGGDRLDKVTEFIETKNSNTTPDVVSIDPGTSISPRATNAGRVISILHKKILFQAYWDPAKNNKLYMIVNTKGSYYTDAPLTSVVTGLKFENGKVPSSYDIVATNPSGSTGSNSNFENFYQFLVNTLSPVKIFLPTYTPATKSSADANTFTFNLDFQASWESLNGTANERNGIGMRLFLDHNGVSPVPSGKITLSIRVTATGYFTETMYI